MILITSIPIIAFQEIYEKISVKAEDDRLSNGMDKIPEECD
jgi:hypothetical protein